LERQIKSIDIAEPSHYRALSYLVDEAGFWIDSLKEIYAQPSPIQQLMISALQSASDFFKATIDAELPASLRLAESEQTR
jgi:hypothetical protein